MEIKAVRLYDSKLIEKFLTQDELWDRISEFGQNKADFIAPIVDVIEWVGLFNRNRLFGIIVIHQVTSISCVAHINIQKQDRYKLSTEAGIVGLKYIINETKYLKVNTEVAVIYPQVIKYVESLGFKTEGMNRKSTNKHNVIVDQELFGITRDEIINKLEKGV